MLSYFLNNAPSMEETNISQCPSSLWTAIVLYVLYFSNVWSVPVIKYFKDVFSFCGGKVAVYCPYEINIEFLV